MTGLVLVVDELSVRNAAGALLVDRVSFSLAAGTALTIVGETGSGKSLVAQAIFGLLPQGFRAEGRLTVRNRETVPFSDRGALQSLWRSHLMLVPQEPGRALDPTMRMVRQLAETADGDRARVAGAMSDVDLARVAGLLYPFELSGGMNQRALVAMGLLTDAPVLVADEPTKGLDRARIGQTMLLLRALLARGRALIVITHDLDVVREIPGVVAVMKDGRIVEAGERDRVLGEPRHPYTQAWLAADPATWRRPGARAEDRDVVLSAGRLAFGWPGQPILFRDLDLDIAAASTIAITGPSGCGKSTLARVLLGLNRPTSGSVSWAGIDPYRQRGDARRKRRRYQKLHQDPATSFIPHRPIGRQLGDLAAVVDGLDLTTQLPHLLDRLRLNPILLSRYPSDISGGEAQRLAILRLLLLEPDVIIADEPTSRLDPITQREVIELLRECIDRDGLALVIISHDLALVRAVAERAITLSA